MKSLFIKQALISKNPFWMYLLGSFIIIIFNLIGQLPLSFVLMKEAAAALASDPMELLRDLDKNSQLFLLLIPFAVGFLGLWLVVVKLHERSLVSITTARPKVDWSRVVFTFLLWSVITSALLGLDFFLNPESFCWNFDLSLIHI